MNSHHPQDPSQSLIPRRPNGFSALETTPDPLALNAHYGVGNSEPDLDLREYYARILRHKWMVITVVIVITTIATILMLNAQSTYTATTVLEIGKESSTVLKSSDVTLENEDGEQGVMTNIKTRIVLLKSQELLEDVVIALKLDTNPALAKQQPNQSWATFLFGIKKSAPNSSPETTAVLRQSAIDANVRAPEERLRLTPFVEDLERNLKVEQINDTRALKISYTSASPELAAAITDSVAQHFIKRSYQSKTERFTNTHAWLDRAAEELRAKVQRAEQALTNYTRANQIFSTEGKSTLTSTRLAQLHDQATRTETDKLLKATLYEQAKQGYVAQLPEAFAEMAARQGSDPKVILLGKRLDELEATEARMNVKFGPDNAQLQEVQQQITVLKTQIEAERRKLEAKLKAEYERAEHDERAIKDALTQAKADAVNENQAAIAYNILKQDVETNKALYTEFLNKANQSRIKLAEQYSNIHVLDHAKIPLLPSGPKRMFIILACFAASLVFGIALALLREHLDNTIKNTDDVTRYAQLPTLAVIPSFEALMETATLNGLEEANPVIEMRNSKEGYKRNGLLRKQPTLLQHQSHYSAATEAYLNLRTSLLLSTAGGPPKMILVTSGEPADGKTTTAINLAVSLTEIGAKVLLIDADLRRSTLHKLVGADNHRGLSTYLSSEEISNETLLTELVQELPGHKLHVLASGPMPPNPTNLLSSPKMQQLLATLGQHYNYILLDSPPLFHLADAVVLSTLVDGVMIVTRSGKSTREALRRARAELASVRANVVGVVLNGVGLQHNDYYYQYHKY